MNHNNETIVHFFETYNDLLNFEFQQNMAFFTVYNNF